MSGPLTRAAYALRQGARVGLFWGQYLLSARLTTPVKARKPIEGPFPDQQRILRDLRTLIARDLANIEAGLYRLPHDLVETPLEESRFDAVKIETSETDWVHCWVEQGKFNAAGGPLNLEQMIEIFRLADAPGPLCGY